ncbi:alpha/beta hydrolase [Methylobacterium sp. ID0610]|uniref:alpha/beta hydrolase n=1 Tax=Methylobacterium carpenticola TaxID=3344827 RepID=UPI0036809A9C
MPMPVMVLACLVTALVLAGAYLVVASRPENLDAYDHQVGQRFVTDDASLAAYTATATAFAEMGRALDALPPAERLKTVREGLDGIGASKPFDGTIVPVSEPGVAGEWVRPAFGRVGCKILYLHGGSFMMGSPLSHRAITTRLARDCDAAVFALRYSLLPENPRKTMIEECRRAYAWLAQASVPGAGTVVPIVLSGDSAGGNLALVTARWATRQSRLPHPAGVVALAPSTDATMASLTRANREHDLLVGPMLDPVLTMHPVLWRLAALAQFKVWPNDPEISPLFGDLSGLPPTLILASSSELLYGDSVRYANKARASGSDIRLQSWTGLPHVWLLMDLDAQAATDGWATIARFVKERAGA